MYQGQLSFYLHRYFIQFPKITPRELGSINTYVYIFFNLKYLCYPWFLIITLTFLTKIDSLDCRYTTLSYRAPEMVNLYSGKIITTKADIWVCVN